MPNTHENLTSLFSDIAGSIRAKTGENRILIADEFPDEIAVIPTDERPAPAPAPTDITWTRPATYPNLDSLNYPNDANEMYFTIDRTKGTDRADYMFSIVKGNLDESLTFGHIENGTYVADTENLMAGGGGVKTIKFADYPSDILLGKYRYRNTSYIISSKVFNPCIIESYVNWTGASNDSLLLFAGENLKHIKFICYNNTISSLSMSSMFANCYSLQSIDFGNNFNTSSVTNMGGMFQQCSSLQSIDFGNNFDTSRVTDMNFMFGECYSLQSINFGNNFDTSSVTDMRAMFENCSSLQSLDLHTFDTSSVTNMGGMFLGCSSLQSVDLSTFDTSSVTTMSNMFTRCSSLQSINFGNNFDTSSVTDMRAMFSSCHSIQSVYFGNNFDTSSVTDMSAMLSSCYSLQSIYFGNNFDTSGADMDSMFSSCKSLQHRTFIDIMNILPEVTTTQTMQFYISLSHKVDPEDVAIGTEKGWTIAFDW